MGGIVRGVGCGGRRRRGRGRGRGRRRTCRIIVICCKCIFVAVAVGRSAPTGPLSLVGVLDSVPGTIAKPLLLLLLLRFLILGLLGIEHHQGTYEFSLLAFTRETKTTRTAQSLQISYLEFCIVHHGARNSASRRLLKRRQERKGNGAGRKKGNV